MLWHWKHFLHHQLNRWNGSTGLVSSSTLAKAFHRWDSWRARFLLLAKVCLGCQISSDFYEVCHEMTKRLQLVGEDSRLDIHFGQNKAQTPLCNMKLNEEKAKAWGSAKRLCNSCNCGIGSGATLGSPNKCDRLWPPWSMITTGVTLVKGFVLVEWCMFFVAACCLVPRYQLYIDDLPIWAFVGEHSKFALDVSRALTFDGSCSAQLSSAQQSLISKAGFRWCTVTTTSRCRCLPEQHHLFQST